MRAKSLISIILACCALLFAEAANAQTNPIKIRFRVDGKGVHQPFRVEISHNGFVLKPEVKNDTFLYPPEFLNDEKVDIRFVSGKYVLDFKDIPLKKFNEIHIGVDNKPFEEKNLPSSLQPNEELVFIYYISYGEVEFIYHVYK